MHKAIFLKLMIFYKKFFKEINLYFHGTQFSYPFIMQCMEKLNGKNTQPPGFPVRTALTFRMFRINSFNCADPSYTFHNLLFPCAFNIFLSPSTTKRRITQNFNIYGLYYYTPWFCVLKLNFVISYQSLKFLLNFTEKMYFNYVVNSPKKEVLLRSKFKICFPRQVRQRHI